MPRRTEVLVDERDSLDSGKEKHYGPYHLEPDSYLKLQCHGDSRFYAGIFEGEHYTASRLRNPGAFPFKFGSDRPSWNLSVNAARAGDYYVVLRVGVFTHSGVIACRIERVGPDKVEPTPPPPRIPGRVSWLARIVGGAWNVVKSRIFQAIGALAVIIADYYVLKELGATDFFAALTAEGTLSLALVTAYFGVMRSN